MTDNPLTLLPAKARQAIYIGYGSLSLVGIGVTAYYGAIPTLTVPDAVTGGLAVLGALAAPIGVLAATNTTDNKGLGGNGL
jgi:hypothetical protein